MILSQYIGDSKTHSIALTWEGAAFTPGEDWALIFTAKNSGGDADSEAVFQKASGAGITVSGSTASVATVPDDTLGLDAGVLVCDLQGQHVTTGEVRTFALGRLKLSRDVTRETTTSVPVTTTETPTPFSNIAQNTHAATAKTTPVDADEIPLADSEASFALKKLSWASIKATLKTYFDTLYAAIGHDHSGIYDPAGSAASAQAAAVQRSNHTGTQPLSSLEGTGAAFPALAAAETKSDQRAAIEVSSHVFSGPFSTDTAALVGGVALYAPYRKTDQSLVWRDAVAEKVALMGDSITAQGSAGLYSMVGVGYGTWARIFGGSQWDAAVNGSVMEFATGGYSSEQIRVTHLPEVLASAATRCVVACGINDHAAGYTSDQTATRLRGMWATLETAGIRPIATTITPSVTNSSKQAWIAATNILIRQYAAEDAVTLCDWAPTLEVSPGVGSADTLPDGVHPNNLGACRLGRALAATLAGISMDPRDNYANTSWLTANSAFAGSSGQPSDWSVPNIVSGAILNSKTLESSANGNWWRLDYTNGSATSRSTLNNQAANTSTVVGKTVEGIMELEVISGGLRGIQLRCVTSGGTQESYDCQGGDNVSSADLITSADGAVVLRTPQTVVSAGVTLLWPQISFSGTAVFRVRRAGIREVAS